MDKTGLCTLKLEKMNKSSNATSEELNEAITKKATFSIVDFSLSGNKQILTKEECEKAKDTIIGKPLKCQYIPSDNPEEMNDDFDSHNEVVKIDRDGEEYIGSTTYAIGVCTNAYIGTITNDVGEEIECLLADYDLWYSDYPSEIKLMFDFYDKGESLYSSCEYYYTSYDISEDGYEMPKDICFSGHVILGSRSNKVDPAYTSSKLQSFNSKWNKAINSMKSQNKEEGKMSKKEEWLKIVNSLSNGDVRNAIYTALSKTMTADEYYGIWISDYDIYDDYFIYEKHQDDDKYHYYKVSYTKTEDEVVVDYVNKKEVKRESIWVSVEEVNKVNNSLKEANAKIADLEKELESAKVEKSSNQNLVEDYNKLSDKVVSLNALVEQMKPIVDQHNKEIYEKSLNSAIAKYKEKFKGVNALEIFEEESTQELIKQSLNADENISKNAIFSLNKLIVDNVQAIEEIKDEDDFLSENMNISINSITETTKSEGNLIPEDEDTIIKEKYGINY